MKSASRSAIRRKILKALSVTKGATLNAAATGNYGNAERAQKLFDAYTLCRDKLMRALQTGATLKVAAAAI